MEESFNPNVNMKTVCYIATDILTCDQNIVGDLFILPNKGDNSEASLNSDSDYE